MVVRLTAGGLARAMKVVAIVLGVDISLQDQIKNAVRKFPRLWLWSSKLSPCCIFSGVLSDFVLVPLPILSAIPSEPAMYVCGGRMYRIGWSCDFETGSHTTLDPEMAEERVGRSLYIRGRTEDEVPASSHRGRDHTLHTGQKVTSRLEDMSSTCRCPVTSAVD